MCALFSRFRSLSLSRQPVNRGGPMIRAGDGYGALSLSPSFSPYSSGKLADIAARVVHEFQQEHRSDEDIYGWESGTYVSPLQDSSSFSRSRNPEQVKIDSGDDDEFEFAVVSGEAYASAISADEIFCDGQFRSTYPLFGTDLALRDSKSDDKVTKPRPTKVLRRSSLRVLMSEDREVTSSSSSDADDLTAVSPEMYCAWSPKDSVPSPESCKKTKSAESSKIWRFRGFLNRSKSDGKEMFMFLNPLNKKTNKTGDISGKQQGKR